MKTTKTLNIDAGLHQLVKVAAAQAGIQIGEYAEAVIQAGLNRPQDVKRLLGSNTRRELPPAKA